MIGGVGGSGTRLVAQFLVDLGFFLGADLNESNDNLWFTLLFKRHEILRALDEEFAEFAAVFRNAMTGPGPLSAAQLDLVKRLAGTDRLGHNAEWLRHRARSLESWTARRRRASGAWGWKEPNTHVVLKRLEPLLPGMKYVHVVRNGLDMAYSSNQAQLHFWGPSFLGLDRIDSSPRLSLKYWHAVHRLVLEHGRRLGDRFLLLNYDRLCAHPEEGLIAFLQFLGSEPTRAMRDRLLASIRPPQSVGRFRRHPPSDLDSDDVAFVRDLGFDTDYGSPCRARQSWGMIRRDLQLLVLGMHRSGTSVLTHLLCRMGCYAGSPESLKPGDDANARGYWERWDAWALDEQILAAAGASWWEVADLDLGSLAEGERQRFEAHARDLVAGLDEHRPWVLKDPRLCVLLPLWRPALSAPVFVLAHRDPLEIAQSIQARDGLPLAVGIALWEVYSLAALRHSLGAPRLCVTYRRLMSDPGGVAAALVAGLAPHAPGALNAPNADDLAEVVASALHHHRTDPQEAEEYLDASQSALRRGLDDGTALQWEVIPPVSAGALEALRSFAAGERERLALRRRAAELAGRCTEAEGDAAWRREREVEHERWIASLRVALVTAESELALLGQRDTEISAWNETLTARLTAVEAEASRLAAAYLDEVERLRLRDTEVSSWNEILTVRLAEAESEASRLAAACLQEQGVSQARQREVEELRRRLDRVRRVLADTARHAEQSWHRAVDLDRLVEEILRSRSWRLGRSLTTPARWGRHATLAESQHELIRREAESLAAVRRSVAAQAARWIADHDEPEGAPGGGE